jgi:hypothetical protein
MNTTEWVILISTLINVLLLFLVYSMHNKVLTGAVHTQNLLNGISSMVHRMAVLEHNLHKLSSAFTDFVDATGSLVDKIQMMNNMTMEGMYRTMDGRYSARTIEELINKIRKDNNESTYFNEDELDKLRQMFSDNDDEEEDNE